MDEAARPAPALPPAQPAAPTDWLEAPAAGALMGAVAIVVTNVILWLGEPGDRERVPAAVVTALVAAIAAGWVIGLRDGRTWAIALGIGLPAFVLGMASLWLNIDPTAAAPQQKPPPSIGPTSERVAFGTGGTGCNVDLVQRRFDPGDQVRFGVAFDPPIPPGTDMRIRVTKGDALVFSFHRNVGTETTCYPGEFSTAGLQPGAYIWSLTYEGSGKPPTHVGFDLAEPAPSVTASSSPEPSEPTAAPSTSPTPESAEPTVQAIAFGAGGTGCAVERDTRSFTPGAQVRFGVTFDPPLPPGTTLQERLTVDSETVFETTRTVETESPCYSGDFSLERLQMGIYRWSVTYDGSPEPPTEVTFSLLRQ